MPENQRRLPRIVHVVTDLDRGGAETMLGRLVASMQGEVESQVITLGGTGPAAAPLRSAGAVLHALDLRRPGRAPAELARLVGTLRRAAPDLVHCWMYHANLVGGLAARSISRAPLIWSLRSDSPDRTVVGSRTAWVARAAAPLSRWLPARIVCPSRSTAETHVAFGYDAARIEVLPNGFETSLFRPSEERRRRTRAALGIEPDEMVIGMVANARPVKDHETFVQAAERTATVLPRARFVLCGAGTEPGSGELARRVAAAASARRFLLLGPRERVHELLPAFDLFTLCSRREAFPNALGEAMACGLPCVATRVGGVAELVDRTALLVPAADPRALAEAWLGLLRAPASRRQALGRAARRRIAATFSIEAAAERYLALYESLLERPGAGVRAALAAATAVDRADLVQARGGRR